MKWFGSPSESEIQTLNKITYKKNPRKCLQVNGNAELWGRDLWRHLKQQHKLTRHSKGQILGFSFELLWGFRLEYERNPIAESIVCVLQFDWSNKALKETAWAQPCQLLLNKTLRLKYINCRVCSFIYDKCGIFKNEIK